MPLTRERSVGSEGRARAGPEGRTKETERRGCCSQQGPGRQNPAQGGNSEDGKRILELTPSRTSGDTEMKMKKISQGGL